MTQRDQIAIAARARGLHPALVQALVQVESSGNTFAWNPEPHYRYLWDVQRAKPFRPLTPDERLSERPPFDFPCLAGDRDQEWWAQQASWGLMQVMGGVARELGFRGPYLPELTNTDLNLSLGCQLLQKLVLWADGNLHQALAAYNAGKGGWNSPTGQAYAEKVLKAMRRIEAGGQP